MTFCNLDQADAIRIRDALKQLSDSEQAQNEADRQIRLIAVQAWWDGIKPAVPTTRLEALAVINIIKGLLETEIIKARLRLLRKKLEEAKIKYKERKLNG